ncbi:hypothetical protein [Burkholderia pyrrocinia]|uniref:hypothetical protein n=1 Tax=Burkholderia pyrrocinia TaxID=60550 RepID=UPI00104D6EA9|nr:hypothetical protein [Burkholderia pyrrocinia]TDA48271.1 hypothetical protein EVG18_06235 [Burkholderia pyrrocinia]
MADRLRHLVAMLRVTQVRRTSLEQALQRNVTQARELNERLVQRQDARLAHERERDMVALDLNDSHTRLASDSRPQTALRNQASRLDAGLASLELQLRVFQRDFDVVNERGQIARAALTKVDGLHKAIHERLKSERRRRREMLEEDADA